MTENITYRDAVAADAIKLSVLYKQVYIHTYGREGVSDEFANFITQQFSVERLSHILTVHPGNVIVAVFDNNLVGVAELEWDKKCPVPPLVAPELNKLYILDWFCGKGIGQALLQEAEQRVRSKGIKEIWLWVLSSNTRAVSFYEKHQYKAIGNASFQMEVNRYENKVMRKQLIEP